MSKHVIKKFTANVTPKNNRYLLLIELSDGSRPDGIDMKSAAELAAMIQILRAVPEVVFDPTDGTFTLADIKVGAEPKAQGRTNAAAGGSLIRR